MDMGLGAMRAALAATEAAAPTQPEAMDVGALTPATEPVSPARRGRGVAPERPSPERLLSYLQVVKQRRDGQAAGATSSGPAG